MTDILVEEQIKVIKRATKTASKSKETAIRFLEEAGIIKKQNNSASKHIKEKK